MLIQGGPSHQKVWNLPNVLALGASTPKKPFAQKKGGKTLKKRGGSLKKKGGESLKKKAGLGLPTKENEGKKRQICIFFAVLAFFGLFYVGKPPFFFVEPH